MPMADSVSIVIEQLERLGPILWEPNPPEGWKVGWAICPCCHERNLRVSICVPLDEESK